MNEISYEIKQNYDDFANVNDNRCIEPIDIIVTLGFYPNEISWQILKNNNILYNGVSGVNVNVSLLPGEYVFRAIDSFGDGWNGATFTISTCDTKILSGTLEDGYSGDFPFTICGVF